MTSADSNTFNTLKQLDVDGVGYRYHDLKVLESKFAISKLPFSVRILIENLLRNEDGQAITHADIEALCRWSPTAGPQDLANIPVQFIPSRVVLQDFTGVPAVVDLAAMRDAVADLGGDPKQINPRVPVDLVIDHSVMVDYFGSKNSLDLNTKIEFQRNEERYRFLRWGQLSFDNFRVVPPGTGIVHQVNLEYLGQVVMQSKSDDGNLLYPDTLVGTDSHTTMINGLGILGWGVGGLEAEAAMLGQPVTMVAPAVIGFELFGRLPEGATATDLVLTVTQMLRKKGVVGKFVEFFGDGLDSLPLADRATIANMAPEYGATCGIFPIDQQTMQYLKLSGRSAQQLAIVEKYAKAQGLWRYSASESKPQIGGDLAPAVALDKDSFSDTLQLDLADVVPSIAGPKRPQDRIALTQASQAFKDYLSRSLDERSGDKADVDAAASVSMDDKSFELNHGDVVIAAITSCTNTSNPDVMIAAGLVARNAVRLGLKAKPWVKTSLAPGSQVVPAYLEQAGVLDDLQQLGFNIVGFGCTTCIGNSGPLPEAISEAIKAKDLTVTAVLSGNRNFEGRIHSDVRANYLASPPLVVAYALAGSMKVDLYNDALGEDTNGNPVYLKDIWPKREEIDELVRTTVSSDTFNTKYADVFKGTESWQKLEVAATERYEWPDSTYVRKPPYFEGMRPEPAELAPIRDARVLVKVGDSITTDHISPAGAIGPDSPAGQYLQEQSVLPADFNSLGSRRGNHEVMMRGTFANVRLRNQLAPGTEGSWTTYWPSEDVVDIFEASTRYKRDNTPLLVLAGKEYGTGSSRDWAAKGTQLLGVKAVIAESYERIHRSNLVGFGVAPLQFKSGESAESLGLTGKERFTISSMSDSPKEVDVTATDESGKETTFKVDIRIDTETEWTYFRHGGILHYVIRDMTQ
ncbi:MAG: aconitate hydratase AcnA [unclassified Hahellaceae]|nr:aconitate hydratase AcnA [Hahellaceae bacterium]|tara:strand:+ start:23682 stop:26429 length:2748 start_codon:yes stop_codon:yes gene_type:complete